MHPRVKFLNAILKLSHLEVTSLNDLVVPQVLNTCFVPLVCFPWGYHRPCRGRLGGDQNVLCVLEYVQNCSPVYCSTRWLTTYGMWGG